jgi:hypothetical protein
MLLDRAVGGPFPAAERPLQVEADPNSAAPRFDREERPPRVAGHRREACNEPQQGGIPAEQRVAAAVLEAIRIIIVRRLRQRPLVAKHDVIGAADAARVCGGFEHRKTGWHAGGDAGHVRSEDESSFAHRDLRPRALCNRT